jgi:16S rRNA pseudouridine516 synthase
VKLDRLLAKQDGAGRSLAREWIAAGRVCVDGEITRRNDREIDKFSSVSLDGAAVRVAQRRIYIMLHKPVGVVSATRDTQHPTVIDLIDDPDRDTLHLVGRLDRNTSGLILLTNDGNWSKALMDPARHIAKIYQVSTRDPIPDTAVEAFAKGFYFHTEDLTTRPAVLDITGEHTAQLTLWEGRYHQIKRMFHRIGNQVTALHRLQIGHIRLPDDLKPGDWREWRQTS